MPHHYAVIAILGGLGAAVLFGSSGILSARAARSIGSASTVAWIMFIGLVIALPLVAVSGPVPEIPTSVYPYLVASALASVIGLVFVFRAIQIGKIGIATAVASTEGAVAATISVLGGESISIASALTLLIIAAGIVAVALVPDEATHEAEAEAGALARAPLDGRSGRHLDPAEATTSIVLAAVSALLFGISLYSTAQVGRELPAVYAVLPARVGGTVTLLLPLLVTRRLRLAREAAPFVIAMAAAEVFGTLSYALGARDSVAIAAVLTSQYAAVAAVAAYVLFHERLTGAQRSGVVAICLGVAVLAGLRA